MDKHIRDYFENGCLCLCKGDIPFQDKDVPDEDAARFYEINCKCSRNYVNEEG